MSKTGKLILAIFLLIGIALIVGGGWLMHYDAQLVSSTEEVRGTVVDIERDHDSQLYSFNVTVEFKHPVNGQITQTYIKAADSVEYRIGDTVYFLYSLEKSKIVRTERPGSQEKAGGFVLVGMGFFFALFGGAPLLYILIKNSRRKKILQTGIPISTQFNRIELNSALTVNGQSPYIIVSHYLDPTYKNKLWEFKSAHLWYNPKQYIDPDQSIIVYVNAQNYKKYAMDMTQFPAIQ